MTQQLTQHYFVTVQQVRPRGAELLAGMPPTDNHWRGRQHYGVGHTETSGPVPSATTVEARPCWFDCFSFSF